eukprot:jgi/Picre1/34677/NNA_002145.t1
MRGAHPSRRKTHSGWIRKFRSVDPPSKKSESFRENVFVEFRMRRPVGNVSESTHGTRHHILGFGAT